MSHTRGAAALLAALVGGVYFNALGGSFHYDDFHSIVHNPHIRQWANAARFFMDPGLFSADPDKAMYRPVLLLSYLINYRLGAYQPLGYLLVNLLIHLGVSLLVWQLARQVGLRPGSAWAAGLVFALHPLASEPVNYISSRSESLAALFYLAGFILLCRDRSWLQRVGWLCYMLGLLTKSVAITLPAVLILYDYYRGCHPGRHWRRYLPLAGIAAGYLVVLIYTRFLTDSLAGAPRSLGAQLAVQAKAAVYYLKLLWVPGGQNIEHQFFSGAPAPAASVWTAVVLVCSLATIAWGMRRRSEVLWVWWAVLTLLPASLVPLNVLVNEHRLYLPLVGWAVGMGLIWERQAARLRPFLLVALGLLAVLCIQRNSVWHSELSLWRDAAGKSPLMPRVHVQLGNALIAAGQRASALASFSAAVALEPDHRAALTNQGNIAYELALEAHTAPQRQAHLTSAQAAYEQVLQLEPTHKEALNNLGSVYLIQQQYTRALGLFDRLVQTHPHFADGQYNRAQAALALNQLATARHSFVQGLQLAPDAAGYVGLAQVYVQSDSLDAAAHAFEQAAALEPRVADHQYNLAAVLLTLGERHHQAGDQARAVHLWERARQRLQRTLVLDPQHKRAVHHLAQLARRLP